MTTILMMILAALSFAMGRWSKQPEPPPRPEGELADLLADYGEATGDGRLSGQTWEHGTGDGFNASRACAAVRNLVGLAREYRDRRRKADAAALEAVHGR